MVHPKPIFNEQVQEYHCMVDEQLQQSLALLRHKLQLQRELDVNQLQRQREEYSSQVDIELQRQMCSLEQERRVKENALVTHINSLRRMLETQASDLELQYLKERQRGRARSYHDNLAPTYNNNNAMAGFPDMARKACASEPLEKPTTGVAASFEKPNVAMGQFPVKPANGGSYLERPNLPFAGGLLEKPHIAIGGFPEKRRSGIRGFSERGRSASGGFLEKPRIAIGGFPDRSHNENESFLRKPTLPIGRVIDATAVSRDGDPVKDTVAVGGAADTVVTAMRGELVDSSVAVGRVSDTNTIAIEGIPVKDSVAVGRVSDTNTIAIEGNPVKDPVAVGGLADTNTIAIEGNPAMDPVAVGRVSDTNTIAIEGNPAMDPVAVGGLADTNTIAIEGDPVKEYVAVGGLADTNTIAVEKVNNIPVSAFSGEKECVVKKALSDINCTAQAEIRARPSPMKEKRLASRLSHQASEETIVAAGRDKALFGDARPAPVRTDTRRTEVSREPSLGSLEFPDPDDLTCTMTQSQARNVPQSPGVASMSTVSFFNKNGARISTKSNPLPRFPQFTIPPLSLYTSMDSMRSPRLVPPKLHCPQSPQVIPRASPVVAPRVLDVDGASAFKPPMFQTPLLASPLVMGRDLHSATPGPHMLRASPLVPSRECRAPVEYMDAGVQSLGKTVLVGSQADNSVVVPQGAIIYRYNSKMELVPKDTNDCVM